MVGESTRWPASIGPGWRLRSCWPPATWSGSAWLYRRADRGPIGRTASWLLACTTIVAITSGDLARLGAVRLSWHMVQPMVLSIVAPMLLVAAAPITLALRSLPTAWRWRGVRSG